MQVYMHFMFNPLVPIVLNRGRLTDFFIFLFMILKKISYERRAYESVDEKSLS